MNDNNTINTILKKKEARVIYEEFCILKDKISEEIFGLNGELPKPYKERSVCALKQLPQYCRILLKRVFPWENGVFALKGDSTCNTEIFCSAIKSIFAGELICNLRGFWRICHKDAFDGETIKHLLEMSSFLKSDRLFSCNDVIFLDFKNPKIYYKTNYHRIYQGVK